MLSIDFEYANGINEELLAKKYQEVVSKLHQIFIERVESNDPKEMVGWYNFPKKFSKFEKIQEIADRWKKLKISDVVISAIGGSYSGVKALLDMVLPNESRRRVKFHFVNSISNVLMYNTIKNVKNKNFALICNSKSGTTTETAIGFRIFRELLWKKFREKSNDRIAVVTDQKRNILHDICKKHKYALFTFPSDVGGRFSTITPVSLLPAAIAGLDIAEIIRGARQAKNDLSSDQIKDNLAYLYASFRWHMYSEIGKTIEFFETYQNNLASLCIQHQQLFGETEGKEGKGILPVVCKFTTDLHSLGQYLQDGKKNFFETTILVDKVEEDVLIPKSSFNDDGIENLTKKSLKDINRIAAHSVLKAHSAEGNTPNLVITLKDTSERSFGYFYFFLSVATTMSALLLGVNPFNQPGVENYKRIMHEKLRGLTK